MTDPNHERNKMMVSKLHDQMARGCINNDWAEKFIEDMHRSVKAGQTLTWKQQEKIEQLFEQY